MEYKKAASSHRNSSLQTQAFTSFAIIQEHQNVKHRRNRWWDRWTRSSSRRRIQDQQIQAVYIGKKSEVPYLGQLRIMSDRFRPVQSWKKKSGFLYWWLTTLTKSLSYNFSKIATLTQSSLPSPTTTTATL